MAEVLITLGIIGVVAAMTMPLVITDVRHKVLENQFRTGYSLLMQGFAAMKADLDGAQIYRQFYPVAYGNDMVFITHFQKYFKKSKFVEQKSGDRNYYTYDGKTKLTWTWYDDGYLDLSNGMNIYVETWGPSTGLAIWLDTNGHKKGPNRIGHDMFVFVVSPLDKLVPVGSDETANIAIGAMVNRDSNNMDLYCNPNITGYFNGIACTYKAVVDKNYFKKLPR